MTDLYCQSGCGTPVRFPGYCSECGRAALVADVAKSQRRGKYNNRHVELPLRHASARDGDRHTFPSQKEANRYLELVTLEQAGAISQLEIQPTFPVCVSGPDGQQHHAFDYIADFRYLDGGEVVVEDAKGVRTAMYRLKSKAVQLQYGITILET